MAEMNIILFLDPEDFVFRFTDGKDVRASGQLSGAQQTICSTILQLALVRVVGPRLGVIQMDEPTVFLDPINRSKLLTLFESMASVLSSSGTITIVPTHDVDLINSCNERVQL
jgi:DNA repair exonuclease SbcCD ATPase subunit